MKTTSLFVQPSLKEQIIECLIAEWPLSAKKIYYLLKKNGKSMTYQAVYKALKEMQHSSVIVKAGMQYSIDPCWANHLREMSERIEKSYQGSELYLKPTNKKTELKNFFERINIPVLQLEGNGPYEYRLNNNSSPIKISFLNGEKFSVNRKWQNLSESLLKKQLKISKNSVTFNGELARVVDFIPTRIEETQERGIKLTIQKTDFFTALSTNYAINLLKENERFLIEKELYNPMSLKDSFLANPLFVDIAVICKHGNEEYAIFQKRNTEKCSISKKAFSFCFGGAVNLVRDLRSGVLDVFSTAENELREELGLSINRKDIAFLGLIRDLENFDVSLAGEVILENDPDKIINVPADSFEVTRCFKCLLTPEAVARKIKDHGGIKEFVSSTLGAIVFSLLKRYSSEHIEKAFKKYLS